jgi:hypothetical protein
MKIDGNIQVPNMIVYAAVYAIVFGISIWLLAFHNDSSTNRYLYGAMTVSAVAGMTKLALHTRRRHQPTA